MSIAGNLQNVKNRMAAAAARVGRAPGEVMLVAVTKTVEVPQILELAAAGQLVIGENRPQALRDRMKELSTRPDLRWHMIGSLQSNKIKYVYQGVEMIHSLDRPELATALREWCQKTGRRCPCLVEVHISDEESKHGFPADEVLSFLQSVKDCDDLDIQGMMGMAPFVEDEAVIRASFRRLAEVFRRSRDLAGKGYQARHLSMGMSDDFELAIEEGATIVRVGRALFEGVA